MWSIIIFHIFQVPPSLLNEDMLKIPHSIEESVMEGIKGIKKMYENDETRKKIGDKLSKMVYHGYLFFAFRYGRRNFDTQGPQNI